MRELLIDHVIHAPSFTHHLSWQLSNYSRIHDISYRHAVLCIHPCHAHASSNLLPVTIYGQLFFALLRYWNCISTANSVLRPWISTVLPLCWYFRDFSVAIAAYYRYHRSHQSSSEHSSISGGGRVYLHISTHI